MLARFGILPALASKAGSIGMGNPSRSFDGLPRRLATARATPRGALVPIGMGNPEQSMDTLSGPLILAVYPLMLRSRSGAREGAGAFCLPEKTHYSS